MCSTFRNELKMARHGELVDSRRKRLGYAKRVAEENLPIHMSIRFIKLLTRVRGRGTFPCLNPVHLLGLNRPGDTDSGGDTLHAALACTQPSSLGRMKCCSWTCTCLGVEAPDDINCRCSRLLSTVQRSRDVG